MLTSSLSSEGAEHDFGGGPIAADTLEGFPLTPAGRRRTVARVVGRALVQMGAHAAGVAILPETRGSGFALAGAGIAIVATMMSRVWVAVSLAASAGSRRLIGAMFVGISAYYAARVLAQPIKFLHMLQLNVFFMYGI